MSPAPDEVDVHHRIAAEIVGKEMKTTIPIEEQHRERRRQDRKGRNDEEIGGERGPTKNRHLSITHTRRPQFNIVVREIDA